MSTYPLTPDFLTFLSELSDNNNRDWFNQNKKRFKSNVEQPFKDFVSLMIGHLQKKLSGLDHLEAKDCVFRIYRDVRFSADKSPYKTHMAALISPGGRKDKTNPGMYLQLSANDARMYSGAHMLDKDQLLAIRTAIIQDLSGFKKARSNKRFSETFGEIHGEKNRRLTPPFNEFTDQEPLLFNKSFYYFKKWNPEEILNEEFPKTLIQTYKAAKPVNDFLFSALQKG